MSASEHPVDEPCELPGGCEDRDRAPLVRAIRRNEAPRAVLERCSEVAAILSTPAMRLAPSPLRLFLNGLPPEIWARAQVQPRDEMVLRRECAEVRASFQSWIMAAGQLCGIAYELDTASIARELSAANFKERQIRDHGPTILNHGYRWC